MTMMLGPGLLESPMGDQVYVSAIGTQHTDNDYVHDDAGSSAAAASISLPARSSGDLLVAFCASPGAKSNMEDTNGNWTTTPISSGNQHQVYTKVASGTSSDNYDIPAASGKFEQGRERMVQIICIKTTSGTPTFMESHGLDTNGTTYDYEITDRDVTVIETSKVLTLSTYYGADEAAGSSLSGDTPYGFTADPSGTVMCEHSYGFLQPNEKYVITGWSWDYMATSTTLAKQDMAYKPSVAAAFGTESEWLAFYAA